MFTRFLQRVGRWIHVFVLLAMALVGWFLVKWLPPLIKDEVTTFSTVGGFITLYGVIFAIIEVVRLETAASQAALAASTATRRLEAIYATRNASECQSSIEHALDDLEKAGAVSSSQLSRIIRLYGAEFSEGLAAEGSPQREKVSIVETYVEAYKIGKKGQIGPLKKVLIGMTAELAAAAGTAKKTTELQG